jgi:hypothetical protein
LLVWGAETIAGAHPPLVIFWAGNSTVLSEETIVTLAESNLFLLIIAALAVSRAHLVAARAWTMVLTGMAFPCFETFAGCLACLVCFALPVLSADLFVETNRALLIAACTHKSKLATTGSPLCIFIEEASSLIRATVLSIVQ